MARVMVLVMSLVLLVGAQSAPDDGQVSRAPGQVAPPRDQVMKDMERENQKAQNKKRFDDIKADTDRLVQLANELKQSVDQANEHTLSIDVIKKAEKVEKLAREVKEKMKG
jgi:hypothetical protein